MPADDADGLRNRADAVTAEDRRAKAGMVGAAGFLSPPQVATLEVEFAPVLKLQSARSFVARPR